MKSPTIKFLEDEKLLDSFCKNCKAMHRNEFGEWECPANFQMFLTDCVRSKDYQALEDALNDLVDEFCGEGECEV